MNENDHLSIDKVSACVASHNRPEYLVQVIECFLNQTYPNKELLIMESGEQPSLNAIEICNKHPNIFYCYQKDLQCQGAKLKRVMAMASGNIIAQWDDDDFYAPLYFEILVNHMKESNADFVKLTGWFNADIERELFVYWDTEKVGTFPKHFYIGKQDPFYVDKDIQTYSPAENFVWGYGFTYIFKKEILKDVQMRSLEAYEIYNPFQDGIATDYKFYTDVKQKGFTLSGMKDSQGLVLHRLHQKNDSGIFPQYILPFQLLPLIFPDFKEEFIKRTQSLNSNQISFKTTAECYMLAEKYFKLEAYSKAKDLYKNRCLLEDSNEEIYHSLFQLALIGVKENDSEEYVLNAFMDCYNYRPNRAEPLYQLAVYYRSKQKYEQAYLCAKEAYKISTSEDNTYRVSKEIYDYKIVQEIAFSAFGLGKYQETYYLTKLLMKNDQIPHNEISKIKEVMENSIIKLELNQTSLMEIPSK